MYSLTTSRSYHRDSIFRYCQKASLSEYHHFVLSIFMPRKRFLQAEVSTSSWFWRPISVSAIRTISSAKSKRKTSISPGSNWIPSIPCSLMVDATLSQSNLAVKELSQSICYSSTRHFWLLHGKKSLKKLSRQTILTKNVKDWFTLNRIEGLL